MCADLRSTNSRISKDNEMLSEKRTHLVINIKNVNNRIDDTSIMLNKALNQEDDLKNEISRME